MFIPDDTIIRFLLDQESRTHRQEAGVNARILLTKPERQPLRDRVLLKTGELLVAAGTNLKCRVKARARECSPIFESRAEARAR